MMMAKVGWLRLNQMFFATMNPGGDFGKRELSPALRSRFDWRYGVPPVTVLCH
jgi:midasin (ATPase involved in ribosome maturation)